MIVKKTIHLNSNAFTKCIWFCRLQNVGHLLRSQYISPFWNVTKVTLRAFTDVFIFQCKQFTDQFHNKIDLILHGLQTEIEALNKWVSRVRSICNTFNGMKINVFPRKHIPPTAATVLSISSEHAGRRLTVPPNKWASHTWRSNSLLYVIILVSNHAKWPSLFWHGMGIKKFSQAWKCLPLHGMINSLWPSDAN